jgi:hypothetical protein
MAVYIVLGILTSLSEVFNEMVFASPTPVIRPQMNVTIVDILVGTDTFIAVIVILAPPRALTTNADEVVGIKATNESRSLCKPLLKLRQLLLAEGTWLVTYLPRHDGRVVTIPLASIAVGT